MKKKIKLDKESIEKIAQSRERLEKFIKNGKVIYSVNTGVGKLADRKISKEEMEKLQTNIIRSHCAGFGEPMQEEIVRGAMFLRAYSLAQGFSGVRPDVVEKIIEFINYDIIPYVPSKGSVGASGDLSPLAHIALALIGEGEVFYKNSVQPAYFVLKQLNIKPLQLKEKEGIALINGTQFSLAVLIDAYFQFNTLFKIAILSALFSFILFDGLKEVFDKRIQTMRNSWAQEKIAKIFRKYLKGYKGGKRKRKLVQDPYTFRCIPQVFGSVYEVYKFVEEIIISEMNAVSDNPLIFPKQVLSGGNFHAQRLSIAGDILSLAITTLSNFSERRTFQLMMLPSIRFLTKDDGLQSGFMLAQVTSSALASENKILSHPASSDSIPTSLHQEDFVSMSLTSNLRLQRMVENLKGILTIEFLSALQGIDLLEIPLPMSLEKIKKTVREKIPFKPYDHPIYKDFQKFNELFSEIEEIMGDF